MTILIEAGPKKENFCYVKLTKNKKKHVNVYTVTFVKINLYLFVFSFLSSLLFRAT